MSGTDRTERRVRQKHQWIDATIGAPGQNDLGIASADQSKCLAYRLSARGTGGGDRVIGSLSVQRHRHMGGRHVGQVLEKPQGKQDSGALLSESVGVQFALFVARFHKEWGNL